MSNICVILAAAIFSSFTVIAMDNPTTLLIHDTNHDDSELFLKNYYEQFLQKAFDGKIPKFKEPKEKFIHGVAYGVFSRKSSFKKDKTNPENEKNKDSNQINEFFNFLIVNYKTVSQMKKIKKKETDLKNVNYTIAALRELKIIDEDAQAIIKSLDSFPAEDPAQALRQINDSLCLLLDKVVTDYKSFQTTSQQPSLTPSKKKKNSISYF